MRVNPKRLPILVHGVHAVVIGEDGESIRHTSKVWWSVCPIHGPLLRGDHQDPGRSPLRSTKNRKVGLAELERRGVERGRQVEMLASARSGGLEGRTLLRLDDHQIL